MYGAGGGGAGRGTRAPARCRALSDEEVALYARPFLPVETVESSSGRPAAQGSLRGGRTAAKQRDDPALGRGKCAWRLPHGTRDVTVETDVGMGRGGPSPSLPHFALPVCSCGHRHFLVSWGGRERAAVQMSASGTCVRACVRLLPLQFASCVTSQPCSHLLPCTEDEFLPRLEPVLLNW